MWLGLNTVCKVRREGSSDGAVVRTLAFHQCDPGSILGLSIIMKVEFVVGSRPCSEGFPPGTPVFYSPQKPTFPNSNLIWRVSPIVLNTLKVK